MAADLTNFAIDATLPLLRPDSVVRPVTRGLFGLYTPSCWPNREEGTLGFVIMIADNEDELVKELKSVGTVEKEGNTWHITRITFEPKWWQHRAEDGMIPAEILEGKL